MHTPRSTVSSSMTVCVQELVIDECIYHFTPFSAVEMATLTRVREEGADEDKTVIRVLPAAELNEVIRVYNEREEERKREQKAKEEKSKQEKATSSAT